METRYQLKDSTLLIKSNLFNLDHPLKVRFNDFNAVLFNESQMDSVNLKYLKFDLLHSITKSYEARFDLITSELEKSQLEIDFLKTENSKLNQLNDNNESLLDTNQKIHDNEILYYKEKAKGKFKSFLLGTSIGVMVATILNLLL